MLAKDGAASWPGHLPPVEVRAEVSSQGREVEWTELSFWNQTNLNSDHPPFLLITCAALGHVTFLSFIFLIYKLETMLISLDCSVEYCVPGT